MLVDFVSALVFDVDGLAQRYGRLLESFKYPPDKLKLLLSSSNWIESNAQCAELVAWLAHAFGGEHRGGVALTVEEHRMFTEALAHSLVAPLPSSVKGKEKEWIPEDLVVPVDYRSPSEYAQIINSSIKSRQLIARHIETGKKRLELLKSTTSSQSEASLARQEASEQLDLSLSTVETTLDSSMLSLQTSIESLSELLSHCHGAIDTSLGDKLDDLLRISRDLDTLVGRLLDLSSIRDTDSPVDIEDLIRLAAECDVERSDYPTPVAVDATVLDLDRLTVEELAELLREEEIETVRVKVEATQIAAKRIRSELATARADDTTLKHSRELSSLAMIQDYLEREQSLLVAAYNALNRTLSFVVEARAMEAVLRLLLVEITESFSAPPPTKIDLSQSTAVQSPTIPELIKLASTALSQYQKQSTPILDHSDLLLAIDRVNSDWGERLGSIDDTRTSISEQKSNIESHQYLYSPTLFLHSTSRSTEALLRDGKQREGDAKQVLIDAGSGGAMEATELSEWKVMIDALSSAGV